MANNVFEQTKEQEIHLASNQIVCKALESLIGFVDCEYLERFFEAFAGNFRPICSDRFASHVLQKMVEIAFLRVVGKKGKLEEKQSMEQPAAKKSKIESTNSAISEVDFNAKTNFTLEHLRKCEEFVTRVGKFLLNNLEDFVWDSCANHIMRTCILCLAGIHVPKVAFEKGAKADILKNRELYKVSNDWLEVMKEFPQRLAMWPQFSDFPYEEQTSALLGVICVALKVADKSMLKHFGKKILMESFLKVATENDEKKEDKIEISDEENEQNAEEAENQNESTQNIQPHPKLPMVFEYQSSVFLLETLLTVAGPKLLTQLYAMLFVSSDNLVYLAQSPLTNFSVQKLLQNIKENSDFESIFNALSPHTEELLKIGHTGVVSELAAACLRLSTKQAQMMSALQTSLQCHGSPAKTAVFFQCLVKLKPHDITLQDKSAFVHLHGSLIVQSLLQYNKPIMLVNCIVESTEPAQLVSIFNTPNGSHIVDAFMGSKYIGEKSREKLIRRLEGFYMELAVSKFGSRVVEQCFSAASQEQQKVRIIKELADRHNMLKGSPFGRLLYNKFRIETYKLSPEQWRSSLNQKESKGAAALFKDILA